MRADGDIRVRHGGHALHQGRGADGYLVVVKGHRASREHRGTRDARDKGQQFTDSLFQQGVEDDGAGKKRDNERGGTGDRGQKAGISPIMRGELMGAGKRGPRQISAG